MPNEKTLFETMRIMNEVNHLDTVIKSCAKRLLRLRERLLELEG